MKRGLSFILSILIVLTAFSGYDLFAFAENEGESGKCGKNAGYSFDSENSCLIVDGSGDIDVKFNNISSLNRKIESIVIKDGITGICDGAFFGLVNLHDIYIGAGVSKIGSKVLSNCKNLEKITVDKNNNYFDSRDDCNAIIKKPSSEDKYITLIAGCKTTKIPDSVSCIGKAAFYACPSLSKIEIPPSVKKIDEEAFYSCTKLNDIQIHDNVEYIASDSFINTKFFRDENNYKDGVLYIGNYLIKAKGTLVGSYAVREGTRLIIKDAFSECTVLSEITIPESVISIDESAFKGCVGLKEVKYSGKRENWAKIGGNISLDASLIHCEDDTIGGTEPENPGNPSGGNSVSNNGNQSAASSNAKNLPKPKADNTKAQITAFKKKTVKLNNVKKGKKSFTATWKKVSGANGYQIQYSLKKNMKSSKTKNVKGAKKTKLTVKKLKKGKKYYVRIRAYKMINGKKVYSKWSAKKTVKVK